MFGGALRFYGTWFGLDSNIASDYQASYNLLETMANFQVEVSEETWRSLTWLGINNDRQQFATRVQQQQLARRKGLPISTLSEEVMTVRRYKNLLRVSGVPDG